MHASIAAPETFAKTESHIESDLKKNPNDYSPVWKELNQLRKAEGETKFQTDLVTLNNDLHSKGLLPNLLIVEAPNMKDGFTVASDAPPTPPPKTIPQASPPPSDSSAGGGNGGGAQGSGFGVGDPSGVGYQGGGGSSGGGGGGGGSDGGGGGGGGDAPAPGVGGDLPPPIDNGSEVESPNDPTAQKIESSLGNDVGSQAVKAELSQLGVPYVWAGEHQGQSFDCSGLTDWAYAEAEGKSPIAGDRGQSIGATAAAQEQHCQQNGQMITNMSDLKPGDLLFYNEGASTPQHVAMYAGNGMMIEAPHSGERVRLVPLRQPDAAGRPTK